MLRFKIALVVMLMAACFAANAAPSQTDINAYRQRMNFYVGLGQSPDQVAVSLNNYFGKKFFYANHNGWNKTVDIQVVQGEGTEINFLETIGTMDDKS